MLRRALLVAVGAVLALTTAVPASAVVEPPCEKINEETGQCEIRTPPVTTPGNPANPPYGGGGGGERVCSYMGEVIDCQSPFGTWVESHQAWCQPADPQPPQDSPLWEGNTVGAIYSCVFGYAGQGVGTGGGMVWMPAPPEAGPTPQELAEQAIAQMNFRAGQIGMTPPPGSGAIGVVGLETWLWITDPGETTTGPITRSASGGGITVTATATVDRIEWSMGDGTTRTCTGPGTPYQESYGGQSSPDCGHTYTRASIGQPGQEYTVTATTYWTIGWSGGGASGTVEMDFSRSTQLAVGEVQSLTTR